MKAKRIVPWWASLGVRSAPPPPSSTPDLADLGTAFGLDGTFADWQPGDTEPVPHPVDASEASRRKPDGRPR